MRKSKSFKTSEQLKREKEAQKFQDELYKKWGIKSSSLNTKSIKKEYKMNTDYRGKDIRIESVPITGGLCSKKDSIKYTGDLIKGIATMHKSNAIPVIDQEHMKDLAKMRR